ncbi:MAG: EAL domain-containing protein [Sandaracinus sp.]|nr:EAL domain-containing protein [Sandaracinus sp.]MCB9621352.1 EAL domain-containing protein [Sandaracinus sp.]MCB9632438.1 EAL domain-containing protein [Sandaracinus sp.]
MTTLPSREPRSLDTSRGGRVAVVDDDPTILSSLSRSLRRAGHDVVASGSAREVLRRVQEEDFDVVVSDIRMPDMDGLALLSSVRKHKPTIPVILVSGSADVNAAVKALSERAFALLPKPCDHAELHETVRRAVHESRERREERERQEEHERARFEAKVRRQREWAIFDAALEQVFVVYQPIVRYSSRQVVGYEALVRSRHPELGNPGLLFGAAHRLERLDALARRIRHLAVVPFADRETSLLLFVNVLAQDLDDETFAAPDSPLVAHAERLVLELSEESRVVGDLARKLQACRDTGMRVAIDDLGAGYASLNSVAEIEPEVIKLDMVLIRDVHRHPVRQRLVRALVGAALELGIEVVAEGVETRDELECLRGLGCDVFQGYLFAKPAPELVEPSFTF